MSGSNSIGMGNRRYLLLLLLTALEPAAAVELSGRFSILGAVAYADRGDLGYQVNADNRLYADQQALRIMVDESDAQSEWSAHLRTTRLHSDGFTATGTHSSALFRYGDLGGELLNDNSTTVRYEMDRLYYRYHLSDAALSVGRQAVEWGSGRFWQPLNVFGAFSPTDLDTDYKPGIDALSVEYFSSQFSSLHGVYALGPEDQSVIKDSGALHYRRQMGQLSQLTLLAAKITGNRVYGAAFESSLDGVGWRIEGVNYELESTGDRSHFVIAGIDYHFDGGTMVIAEYYNNSRGATSEQDLSGSYSDPLIASGLQQHLSRQLVGIGLSRDLTPLLNGGYTLIASQLDDGWSQLHQFNLVYSVSNESDLLASLMLPTGKGLATTGQPRSEFGHLPASLTLRLRVYF
ncbi:MAG: hypothetical protein OEZ16_06830 [Chromatiales bacterium]|nr:hypothetical protein [Chromatiales bacterium]